MFGKTLALFLTVAAMGGMGVTSQPNQPDQAAKQPDKRGLELAANIMINPGFEIGDDDKENAAAAWSTALTQPPSRSQREFHTGGFSMRSVLKNVGATPSEGHLMQTLKGVAVGGWIHELTFWLKQIDAGPSYVQQFQITWIDGAGVEIGTSGFKAFAGKKGKWTEVRAELKAPPNAVSAKVLFRFVTGAVKGGRGEVYLDDIGLIPQPPMAVPFG